MSSGIIKTVASNRRARFHYEILQTVEAGLVLTGSEIKSIRASRVSLSDSYARPALGEMWLMNAHIAPYHSASLNNHDAKRPRKLLLNKSEIRALSRQVEAKGLTIVPLRMYLTRHVAKVELGLGRGRRRFDKRRVLIEREREREARGALKRG